MVTMRRGRRRRQKRPRTGRKRRRGQRGGFLPLALLPLLAMAGKVAATGALSGAAGFGVKKALEKISK